MWAGFVAAIAGFFKFILPIIKIAKFGKILLTGGTMLLSVAFYSLRFGWPMALGFVITILIHELGHVYMAWRQGEPVSAPIFIPGMGALILLKGSGKSAWHQALIGIGGPLFGAVAALTCYLLAFQFQSTFFLVLAMLTFSINLFNMVPFYPLDGGRITGAVSPYLWILGIVILGGMMFTGYLRNPMILIIIVLSIPNIISSFRRGTLDPPGTRTLPSQRIIMGAAYITLTAFLAAGVALSMAQINNLSRQADERGAGGQVALRRSYFSPTVLEEGAAEYPGPLPTYAKRPTDRSS